MKIICISDTHGQHGSTRLPEGDLLIHAGDISSRGKPDEVAAFLRWFAGLPHRYKVFVGGNHDFFLEKEPTLFRAMIPRNCFYLEDSAVEIEGLTLWGSPVTPFFYNWAFNRRRGTDIRKHWDRIPAHTDILITHGPPYGVLDQTARGEAAGCADLLQKIADVQPRLHVFGHIHEACGKAERDGTIFVNACYLDLRYQPAHAPVVVEWTV
ncbi:MAG: metallophosphatase domain-containing protein [Ferruginibacter sp.]|nr:metallophosphatase domain-containing protein [Cytophagales bacterium]